MNKSIAEYALLLSCCLCFTFYSCSSKHYLTTNKIYIPQPYPYYNDNRYEYLDELNININDSTVHHHFYARSDIIKSLEYFEFIDNVEEAYRLKIYSNKVHDGFKAVNTRISKEYKERGLKTDIVLSYFINKIKVTSNNDVIKLVSLNLNELKRIDCLFSTNLDSCNVYVELK